MVRTCKQVQEGQIGIHIYTKNENQNYLADIKAVVSGTKLKRYIEALLGNEIKNASFLDEISFKYPVPKGEAYDKKYKKRLSA